MTIKTCFGWVAVGLTILGISGIFLSGIVGLVWGPLCLLGDNDLQKQMNCSQIVRSKPISMALIVCGFMVLSLTIAIVTIEVRTQVAERLNGNDPLTLNNPDNFHYKYSISYADIQDNDQGLTLKIGPNPNYIGNETKKITSQFNDTRSGKNMYRKISTVSFDLPNENNTPETLLSVQVDKKEAKPQINFVQSEVQSFPSEQNLQKKQFEKLRMSQTDESANSTPCSANFKFADDIG
ncbi:uncharacterized protein LOC134855209 [Symsagittifera roscoffensis]|uniref:uncharacterized protein LOC134855209 n=1 Tax=Symsagittifera roscoffensis TaxID=84072 RepID=UPI00307C5B78